MSRQIRLFKALVFFLFCVSLAGCGGGSSSKSQSPISSGPLTSSGQSSSAAVSAEVEEVARSIFLSSSYPASSVAVAVPVGKVDIIGDTPKTASSTAASVVVIPADYFVKSSVSNNVLVSNSDIEALSSPVSSGSSNSSSIFINSSSATSSSISFVSSAREAVNAKSSVALSSVTSLQSSSVDLSSSSIMSALSSVSSLSLTSSSLNSNVNELGSSLSSVSSYVTSAIAESSASNELSSPINSSAASSISSASHSYQSSEPASATTSSQPVQAIKSDIQLKREVDEAVSQVDQQSIENISLSLKKSFGNEVTDYEWAVDYEHTLDAMFRSSTSISPTSIQCKATKCVVKVVVNDDEQSLASLEIVRDSVNKALSVTPKVFFVTDRENHLIEFYFSRSLDGNLFQ